MPFLSLSGSNRMSCAVVMAISRQMKVCIRLMDLAVLSSCVVS